MRSDRGQTFSPEYSEAKPTHVSSRKPTGPMFVQVRARGGQVTETRLVPLWIRTKTSRVGVVRQDGFRGVSQGLLDSWGAMQRQVMESWAVTTLVSRPGLPELSNLQLLPSVGVQHGRRGLRLDETFCHPSAPSFCCRFGHIAIPQSIAGTCLLSVVGALFLYVRPNCKSWPALILRTLVQCKT